MFIEPLAAACQILDQLDIRKFGEAAVLGDGKLAQLIALVLQAAGARVTMYGKHAEKLALAWRAGVKTKKVRGDAGDLKRVNETFRLVVEATGSPTGLTLAQRDDRATRHAAAEIHISRGGAGGDVAYRGEGNYCGRVALRAVC